LAEAERVDPLAMGATRVHWKPVWAVQEEQFEQMVVNSQHIKAVPGRKTDTHDRTWIADLLRHGLLKSNFLQVAVSEAPR
jgi:transposase